MDLVGKDQTDRTEGFSFPLQTQRAGTQVKYFPLNKLNFFACGEGVRGNRKSLQALGVPPRNPEAPGHALTEHSTCFPSATSLFIQTLGLQRENSMTEPLHKWARNQGRYRMERKTNKKESININRDKIDLKKKKRPEVLKKKCSFSSVLEAIPVGDHKARCLSCALEELWKDSLRY